MKITRHMSQWFAALTLLSLVASTSKAMRGDEPPTWREQIEEALTDRMGADLRRQVNELDGREQQVAREERDMLEQAISLVTREARLTGSIAKPSLDLLLSVATVNRMDMPMGSRLLEQRLKELEAVECTMVHPPSTAIGAQLGRLMGDLKETLRRRGRVQALSASAPARSVREEAARIIEDKKNEIAQREAIIALLANQQAILDSELRQRAAIMQEEAAGWHDLDQLERAERLRLLARQRAVGVQAGPFAALQEEIAVQPEPAKPAPAPPRRTPRPPRRRPAKTYQKKPLPPRRGRLYTEEGELREKYRQ